jgi:hypothetical protein
MIKLLSVEEVRKEAFHKQQQDQPLEKKSKVNLILRYDYLFDDLVKAGCYPDSNEMNKQMNWIENELDRIKQKKGAQ